MWFGGLCILVRASIDPIMDAMTVASATFRWGVFALVDLFGATGNAGA